MPTTVKQVRPSSGTDVYQHMPILRPHAGLFHERRISGVTFTLAHLYSNVYMRVGVVDNYSMSVGVTRA